MGTRIVAKDVDAEAFATEYAAPIRRGLEAIHFLNGSLVKAARNYAPGKAQGKVVGAPVPQAAYLSCKGTVNCIETAMSEAEAMTLFIVARTPADGTVSAERPMFLGNYQGLAADGGAAWGVSIFVNSENRVTATGGFGADAASNTNVLAGVTKPQLANKWGLYMLQVSSAGVTMRDFTSNLIQTTNASTPRRLSTGKIRVGSGQTNLLGLCDVAVFQGHSALLTDAEIQTTVADIRAYVLRKGVVV
ncbi:TPA: hypothetical protein ACKP2Y_003487 [Pseudomonas putida]